MAAREPPEVFSADGGGGSGHLRRSQKRNAEESDASSKAAKSAASYTRSVERLAEEEGLTLLQSESSVSGFLGVTSSGSGTAKPYMAKVRRGGAVVGLGTFATAEEAALAIARLPESRAAAAAAAAPPRRRLSTPRRCRRPSSTTACATRGRA